MRKVSSGATAGAAKLKPPSRNSKRRYLVIVKSKSVRGQVHRVLLEMLESRAGIIVRRFLQSRLVRNEKRFLATISDEYGGSQALMERLRTTSAGPHSPAFFILGNGDSVNVIPTEDFAVMVQNLSVGLNAWPLHPHVPHMYSFEFGNDTKPLDKELRGLVAMAVNKAPDKPSDLMFLRPSVQKLPLVAAWLKSLAGPQVFFHGRINLTTRQQANLGGDIKWSLDRLSRGNSNTVLLDNGASVVRMISLALLTGFKRIVLAGVDLNGSDYFWFNSEFIEKYGDFTADFPRKAAESELTLSTDNRPFSTRHFILQLAVLAEQHYGAQVFVATKEQALATDLMVFDFSKERMDHSGGAGS